MVLQPVGPLPAATYWRRRLVLVVGALVLLLVARSCVGGGPRRTGASSPSPTPSVTATASPAAAHPSATPTRRPAGGTGTCGDADLRVTVRTDATSYPVGSSPRFTVTVTNTSATPCRRDLGPDAVELVVSSGSDRIWSSDDCAAGTGAEVLTIKAAASLEQTVTWSGKRSAKGCPSPSTRPQAAAGYYRVVARVGTLRSAPAVFRMRQGA